MPRTRRLVVPGIPLHVVQRGVNRVDVFGDDADRRHYLALLERVCRAQAVAVHAYVLMTNHVHLLVSAAELRSISTAMHRIGTSYVLAYNRRHDRVGALWQGRFKSCLVDHERHLLAVYRYIELNPVRAGIVDRPEAYAWSSVHGNGGYHADRLLTPHPAFVALAPDDTARAERHRAALREVLGEDFLRAIRTHTARQSAFSAPNPPRGRPKKGDAHR
ncbi:MAG TPA: transposase [Xanthomonadales bacterium]|nr:transposase [Xanthomonadales bacterium]